MCVYLYVCIYVFNKKIHIIYIYIYIYILDYMCYDMLTLSMHFTCYITSSYVTVR